MSDPFNILNSDLADPPTFDAAVSEVVTRFQHLAERFAALEEQVPEAAFTDEEWRVVELTAADLETALERAEEGYVAVAYDSHAWYRIMESLETVNRRLESAIGLIERVRDRASE